MKKVKKILLGTILAATCAFSACGAVAPQAEGETAATATTQINSFESQLDLNYMSMQNVLGRATLEKDAQYIKSGETSMKVWVQPNPFNDVSTFDSSVPYLMHSLERKRINEDYTNFKNVTKVKVDVYNAQDTVEKFGLNICLKAQSRAFVCTKTTYYDVQPGWNTVEMEITKTTIPSVYKRKAIGVSFVFERPKSTEPGNVFYLDDFRLEETKEFV